MPPMLRFAARLLVAARLGGRRISPELNPGPLDEVLKRWKARGWLDLHKPSIQRTESHPIPSSAPPSNSRANGLRLRGGRFSHFTQPLHCAHTIVPGSKSISTSHKFQVPHQSSHLKFLIELLSTFEASSGDRYSARVTPLRDQSLALRP